MLVDAVESRLDDARVGALLRSAVLRSSPLGPPAISTKVGSQSSDANIWLCERARLDVPGQRIDQRHAIAAFAGFTLLAHERRHAAVGEGDRLGAVVGGEDDDRVVELAHVLELLQDIADIVVELLHAGFVFAPVLAAGLADHRLIFRRQHRRDVHAGGVVPDEERLAGFLRVVAVEEVDHMRRDFLVHRARPLQRRAGLRPCTSGSPGFRPTRCTRSSASAGSSRRLWPDRRRPADRTVPEPAHSCTGAQSPTCSCPC